MSKQVTLQLPWPPTVNTYWRNIVIGGQARVLISEDGRNYKKAVRQIIATQRPRHFGLSSVQVDIQALPPDKARRDLDNLVKALFDSLSDEVDRKTKILNPCGVWRDDCQVDEYRIHRGPVVKAGRVVVTITELVPVAEQANLLGAA